MMTTDAPAKGSTMKLKDPKGFMASRLDKQLSLFEKEGIPLTPEGTAPLNNHLARSSLFAPIKRGKRKYHKGTVIASQGDTVVKIYGEQLDMADQNVLLHAYHLASGIPPLDTPTDNTNTPAPLNSRVVFNRADFLSAIHMTKTGPNYKWLHNSLMRLATSIIEIETKHYSATYQLIGPPQLDKDTETYFFHIPKSSFAFFFNQSFGYVNMARRLGLTVQVELASWIQAFVVSHDKSKEHKFTLSYLRNLCAQERPLRKFRTAFREALKELIKQGEFDYADLDENDMFIFKPKSEYNG